MKIGQLIAAELAIEKLLNYGYLPVSSMFYLSKMYGPVRDTIHSYHKSRGLLFQKHGKEENGGYVVPAGKPAEAFRVDEAELLDQDVEFEFPPEQITLCVQSIHQTDDQLLPEKRLGFTAKDWLVIQEVIKVVETEE